MKKKILALLTLMVLLFTGCGGSSGGLFDPSLEQETAVLYFANAQGNDLTAVNLDVRDMPREELPRYILEKLLEGPAQAELTRAVRAGTDLLSVSMEGALVKVDLSKEYYHEESIYDVLALASVVKSLCSIRGITQVLVTIEGQPLLTAEGEEQGILKESDVVFDADALMQDEANITLYFSDLNAESLVREVRRVKVARGESLEKLVVQELISGPKGQESARTIPSETKIRSIETKDKVCFVNLSSEFVTKNNVGSSGEQLTIYSIVNSLTELSNIDKVQFLIEGEKREVYHHMIFNEPIGRDISIMQR